MSDEEDYASDTSSCVNENKADNLSNSWGVDIFPPSVMNGIFDTCGSNSYDQLQTLVKKSFKPFELVHILPCGSDANMYALIMSTKTCIERTMIPNGTYVSGDRGVLQGLSTSRFTPFDAMVYMATPKHAIPDEGKKVATPFPYHIPNAITTEDLQALEESCLVEIKHKILLNILNWQPIRCVLMELMLACNGAILSDGFLTTFAALCQLFGIVIVVDEILTAGRTGRMLLWSSKPQEFKKEVAYITLGKWTHAGLVLRNPGNWFCKEYIIHYKNRLSERGYSTMMDPTTTYRMIERVFLKYTEAASRRAEVLRFLKVSEDSCWGEGILIFCERYKLDRKKGSHTRFLPWLQEGSAIEDCCYSDGKKKSTNKKVQASINNVINLWLKYCDDNPKNRIDRIVDRIVVKFLWLIKEDEATFQGGKRSLYNAISGMEGLPISLDLLTAGRPFMIASIDRALLTGILVEKRTKIGSKRFYTINTSMFEIGTHKRKH